MKPYFVINRLFPLPAFPVMHDAQPKKCAHFQFLFLKIFDDKLT